MSKQSIKATIDANIKQNGIQAITGQIMNSVLNQMVDNLAEEASTTEDITKLESEVVQRILSGNIPTTYTDKRIDTTIPAGTILVNNGIPLNLKSDGGQTYYFGTGIKYTTTFDVSILRTSSVAGDYNITILPNIYKKYISIFEQSFSDEERQVARANISAASTNDISIVNLNEVTGKTDSYTTRRNAYLALPSSYQRGGITIKYLLNGEWVIDTLNYPTWNTAEENWMLSVYERDIDKVYDTIANNKVRHLPPVTFDETTLYNGYWATPTSLLPNPNRLSNKYAISVKKGGMLVVWSKDLILSTTLYDVDGVKVDEVNGIKAYPYHIKQDGELYFTLRNADGNTPIPVESVVGKIFYTDNYLSDNIRTTIMDDLFLGYVTNAENRTIAPHPNRITMWNPLHVRKGDHIRLSRDDVYMQTVLEYNETMTLLLTDSTGYWATSVHSSAGKCSDYVVKNDGYVIIQFNGKTSTYITSLAGMDGLVTLIHPIERNVNDTLHTIKATPRSPKKPRKIGVSSSILRMAQDATFINGKLWMAYDDYLGTFNFQVIDPVDGTIEKVISHDFSHCNSLDYNINNDSLLFPYGEHSIAIYSNVASVNDSMSIDDAVIISIPNIITASACWGEDEQTIYVIVGATEQGVVYNKIYKIILGYNGSSYDGTYTIVKTFGGDILDGVDTYHDSFVNNGKYAQGCEYDGYLYLAYGNKGHNVIVIDLDDDTETFRVVGNYVWKYYDNDHVEHYVEPEGVALNGDKIVIISRNYEDNIGVALEFNQ